MPHFWPLKFWKRSWWQQWFRTALTTGPITTLSPRVIYIIPTRWGLLFGLMVLLLFLGSVNYTLSLGYFLTFLLASLGVVAMFHTWLNFAHLEVESQNIKPVFASETAIMQIKITDKKNRTRHSIAAHFDENETVFTDVLASENYVFSVPITTHKRGWQALPKLVLHTEFPLGLLHAWSVIRYPHPFMVYAKPSAQNNLPSHHLAAGNEKPHQKQVGDDDFNGHKTYQLGDAPSRLDWKASSRGMGLLTKQYSGNVQETLWLDWADTSRLAFEERVSLLTKAVIEAHTAGLTFGLKLPTETFAPSHGETHYHACLQALALL